MKKVKVSKFQGFLVGQLIVSIIAIALLIFDDFGGYYHYDYYNKVKTWGYVYFGSGFFTTLLMIVVLTGFAISAYSAFIILKDKRITSKLIKRYQNLSFKTIILSLTITIIGAVVFIISNVIDQTQEWWLDSSFFGSFIGGILLIFLKMFCISIP